MSIVRWSDPSLNGSPHGLFLPDALASWPGGPLPLPPDVSTAVEVLNSVSNREAPTVTELTPAEFIAADLEQLVAAHTAHDLLLAWRVLQTSVAAKAATALGHAIRDHSTEMFDLVDEEWTVVFEALPNIDLGAPQRLAAADLLEVTPETRSTITSAQHAAEVCTAVVRLTRNVKNLAHSEEAPWVRVSRVATFPSVDVWQAFKHGIDIHDNAPAGMTLLQWASKCGCRPAVIRTAAEFEQRKVAGNLLDKQAKASANLALPANNQDRATAMAAAEQGRAHRTRHTEPDPLPAA